MNITSQFKGAVKVLTNLWIFSCQMNKHNPFNHPYISVTPWTSCKLSYVGAVNHAVFLLHAPVMLVCCSALKMNDLIYLLLSAGRPGNGGPRWCVVGLPICFHLGGILFCKKCISLQWHPRIKWQVWRKWGQIFSNNNNNKKKNPTLYHPFGNTSPHSCDSFLRVIFVAFLWNSFDNAYIWKVFYHSCSFTIIIQIS